MRPDWEKPTDIDSMEYPVDSDVCLLLYLLLDEMLLKVAIQIAAEDFSPDMVLYYREPDVLAKIQSLLPDEFRGGMVMDVQKIDGCVMKRMKA